MKRKLLLVFYLFFCIMIIFSNVCYGYLDPSAMTYLIQVVAAIVIAVSTSIGIIFYKLKRKFFGKKKKEKSENSNDEIDSNDSSK